METYLNGFPGNYKTPSLVGTQYTLFNLITAAGNVNIYWDGTFLNNPTSSVKIENSSGTVVKNITRNGTVENNTPFTIEYGENIITYTLNGYTDGSPISYITLQYIFIIQGVTNRYPLKPWTNEEVINRVLQLAEPLRYGVDPSFRLRKDLGGVLNKQFTAFAPEFTFTRMNLREVMQTIGGVLHAAPRLQLYDPVNAAAMGLPLYSGEWFFEKFGNEKLATYKDREDGQEKPYNAYRYTTRKCSHEIEQACTKLDSYMDNLVNRINWQNGTVSKPSTNVNYGITLRAENLYIRVTEEEQSAYIPTEFPIDKIVKLEVVYRVQEDGIVVTKNKDIVDFVFPKSVYDNLSSYGGNYPASKSYVLYFAQGQKDIKGFFFKAPSGFGGTVGSTYSIINILKTVGVPASVYENYPEIEFRITYVPIYSTRIQHSKAYLGDHLSAPRTLNYSQSDNSVETRFFGENIKGAAQRLGTAEKFVTFNIKRLKNVPKAGDLWDDDYYISTVQISALQDRFEITCGLSQHFNRKSKYIGADSHKRIYEVSETMVQQRHTVMEDYIVIEPATGETAGLTKAEYDNSNFGEPLMYGWGINEFWNVIGLSTATKIYAERVQSFTFKGFNFNRQAITANTITLPCVTSAFGNVIEFTAECTDNFSAGTQVKKTTSGKITGYFTQGTTYSDYYGRMYYIGWAFGKGWIDDSLTPTNDEYANQALAIPQDTISKDVQQIAAGTGFDVNDLQLYRKDSREALKFTYRLETVAGDKSFIIGSALSSCNPLVINEDLPNKPRLYVLSERLGKFDNWLNENIAVNLGNAAIAVNGYYASSAGKQTSLSGKAWVIAFPYYNGTPIEVENEAGEVSMYVPRYGGEILIGRNIDVSVGDTVGDFVAYVVHDLQAYITARRKAGKLKL